MADLYPGYFALVMATGIVSIGAHLLRVLPVARALLVVNVAAYAALASMFVARLAMHPRRVVTDFCDYGRGPGFFTVVAGTCVLGTQLQVVAGLTLVPRVLWGVGICAWVIVMYGFFTATITREDKPSLEAGINGAWLIAAVATQSVSVLGALLAPGLPAGRDLAMFFALCMCLLGAMLYVTLITLIFYRFTFLALPFEALTPPYWINMGAVAITTLAGSTLLLQAEPWPVLVMLRPFLTGFTLFFWVSGSWWIPLLLILGVWRHLVHGFPLRYDPQYWGMVFPIGMYAVCTARMSEALDLPFLLGIPMVFGVAALAAWLVVFAGMLRALARTSA